MNVGKITKKLFCEPKISFGMFILFIVLTGFVVWYGFSRGNERKLSNLTKTYYIGQTINTPDISFMVHSVRRDKIGLGPLVPKQNYEFVIATISIENNTSRPFDLIPLLHLHIKDRLGNVYNVSAVPSDTNQLSGPILPYDKLKEEVGFEVSKDATGLKLYFEPGLSDRAIITVNLQ